ncbi:hypothetical protein C8R48DRAFT_457998 [Suillus tomentosus]|nr:hypothetical protein C8R48DRAFT_457998 [Suillus tomentosus]
MLVTISVLLSAPLPAEDSKIKQRALVWWSSQIDYRLLGSFLFKAHAQYPACSSDLPGDSGSGRRQTLSRSPPSCLINEASLTDRAVSNVHANLTRSVTRGAIQFGGVYLHPLTLVCLELEPIFVNHTQANGLSNTLSLQLYRLEYYRRHWKLQQVESINRVFVPGVYGTRQSDVTVPPLTARKRSHS